MAQDTIDVLNNSEKPRGSTIRINEVTRIVKEEFSSWGIKEKQNFFKELGLGTEFFTCQRCGKTLAKEKFYISADPSVVTGYTSICRDCAEEIACPTINGQKTEPTKSTVDAALRALDKPFLEQVWDDALLEATKDKRIGKKSSVWSCYIKHIQLKKYGLLRYQHSDGYTGGDYSLETLKNKNKAVEAQEIIEQFDKNKTDTLRLLGYLPFEKEKLSDQPFLYGQLIGFLDSSTEGNDDMMRTQSIISIVRGFLQMSQIDDEVVNLLQDSSGIERNAGLIRTYANVKKELQTTITKLAEQSCISLKNSRNAKKGENTWTGKIKKIKELNLREGEVNGFDIGTCRGMQQVLDASNASILKQLALDESEWSDMVAEMRKTITDLRSENSTYKEICRILLRENLDLKDLFSSTSELEKHNLVDLEKLFSPFSEIEDDTDGGEDNFE